VVTATVSNTGNASGNKDIEFEVEGQLIETRSLVLKPNETRTLTFTRRFTTPGTKTVEVDTGKKWHVEVEPADAALSVTDVSVSRSQVRTGESFSVNATVENSGYATGTTRVELVLFDEVVATRNVTVAEGETATVTFERSIASPGTYEAIVGNHSVNISVAGATETNTSQTTGTTTGSTPGLGPLGALVALLLAAVLFARRAQQ